MNARFLEIASSSALQFWATSCPYDAFLGVCRVETQNAIYLFRNGRCFAGSGRGPRAGTTSSEMVGMRLAGWLLPSPEPRSERRAVTRRTASGEEAQAALAGSARIRVSRAWREGARAILTSGRGPGERASIALTSPVATFNQYVAAEGADSKGQPFERPPTPTLTRIGVAIPVV